MTEFVGIRGGGVMVRLDSREIETLQLVTEILESVGDAASDPGAARLDVSTYPEDDDASFEFRRLMASEVETGRNADRSAFSVSLEAANDGELNLSAGEAEAWLVVIGEARLVLAARLGIEAEGWGADEDDINPPMALLHYLSWVQGSLSEALLDQL
jgi:hypothetical protein